jgi:hypothetical protein
MKSQVWRWLSSRMTRRMAETDQSFRGAYCLHHPGDEAYSSPWEPKVSPSLGSLKAGDPVTEFQESLHHEVSGTNFSAVLYLSLDITKGSTSRHKCHPRRAICSPLTLTRWDGSRHSLCPPGSFPISQYTGFYADATSINFGRRWRWVVSFTRCPSYPRAHLIGDWLAPRPG